MPSVKLIINGTVPSFKNRKRIGKHGLYTDPEIKSRMNEIIASIESQLRSLFRQNTDATWTESQLRSWIASCLPEDDCWTCVPLLIVTGSIGTEDVTTITVTKILP